MRRVLIIRQIRLGIKTLLLHKLQSFLTMLGVVFGVGSVVAMLAVGEGASEQALQHIRKLGSHNIIISSIKPTDEQSGGTSRVRMVVYGLHYDDEIRVREGFPAAVKVAPAKVIRKDGRLGARTLELRVVGTTPAWFELIRRPFIAGRALTDLDVKRQANVAVLTEYGARRLLATANIIGPDTIEVYDSTVQKPVAVRYGWAHNPACNLSNKEGLPASPFRTDNWEPAEDDPTAD